MEVVDSAKEPTRRAVEEPGSPLVQAAFAFIALLAVALAAKDVYTEASIDPSVVSFIAFGIVWIGTRSYRGTTLSKQTPTYSCAVCNKPGVTARCPKCKTTWYCGKDCQAAAWPQHKQVCKDYAETIKEREEIVSKARELFSNLNIRSSNIAS